MGPKRDPGSSLLQSACPSLPGEGVERPRPDDLKWGGGRCVRLVEAGKGQAWGKGPSCRSNRQPVNSTGQAGRHGPRLRAPGSGLQPTAAVHLHPAANTSMSVPFSLHLSVWCSSNPPLLYSFFTAPLSCPTPRAPIHPSTPAGQAILTRVFLQPLRRLEPRRAPRLRSPPSPHRLEGRGAGTTRQRCAAAPLHAWAWRVSDPAPSA